MGFFDKPEVTSDVNVGLNAAKAAAPFFQQMALDQPGAMEALEGALFGMGQAKQQLALAPEFEASIIESSRMQAKGASMQQQAASGITGANRSSAGNMAALMGQAKRQAITASAAETQSRFQNFLGSVATVNQASAAFDVKPMVTAAMQGAYQQESARLAAEAQGSSMFESILDAAVTGIGVYKFMGGSGDTPEVD